MWISFSSGYVIADLACILLRRCIYKVMFHIFNFFFHIYWFVFIVYGTGLPRNIFIEL